MLKVVLLCSISTSIDPEPLNANYGQVIVKSGKEDPKHTFFAGRNS